MSITDLYIFCQPLIDILGTLCLIALIAGSVLYVMFQILKRIWKFLIVIGLFLFCVLLVLHLWGGV